MKVVHCKRDAYDVYVGRPSIWGNPFTVQQHGRGNAVRLHAEFVRKNPQLIAKIKRELRGKILACWCAPKGGVDVEATLMCHAQTLAKIANE
jgi:hypothetical protein